MNNSDASLHALHNIRRMMRHANRFLSLSGFSGIAAGLWGLAGAFLARQRIRDYEGHFLQNGFAGPEARRLLGHLVLLALAVFSAALVSAFYFTWRKASREHAQLWNGPARQLAGSMLVPLATGGLLIAIVLLQTAEWALVVPLMLVFYGLALVSGSRFSHIDMRYLGLCQVALGLLSTGAPENGIYFWAAGFGLLHILYGARMWWKYERGSAPLFPAH